jgi:hypothetical protein
MKKLLTFLIIGMFVTSFVYFAYADSESVFRDHSGIGNHEVIVGDSSDTPDPNGFKAYGGGSDACYTDPNSTTYTSGAQQPAYFCLEGISPTGTTTGVLYYFWFSPMSQKLKVSSGSAGDSSTNYGIPGDANLDLEASGADVYK